MTLRSVLLLSAAGLFLLPTRSGAQTLEDYDYENLTFAGIGADAGYVWPNKVEGAPAFNVRVDLGFLGPGVRIVPMIGFWTSSVKRSELVRLAAQLSDLPVLRNRGIVISADSLGEIDWSDLTFGVDAHYVWETAFGVDTYLGGGLAVHALNGSGEVIEGTFVEDLLDTITAGASAVGGVELGVTRWLRFFGEARYTITPDLRYPSLSFGGSFVLPPVRGAP